MNSPSPKLTFARCLTLGVCLIIIGFSVWIGWTKHASENLSPNKNRYASFDWPGDVSHQEIEITYTARDATTVKRRFGSLSGALGDLADHGWQPGPAVGKTLTVQAGSRTDPDVYISVGPEKLRQ